MNLSFDINTQEGDRIIVSLSSSYSWLYEIVPVDAVDFEIVEVSIIREKGMGPVPVAVFGRIADILVDIAEDNQNTILFYFCDIVEGIPRTRPGRKILSHEYRNALFKLLFQRYRSKAREHWSDIEINLLSNDPPIELYAHFLLRDRHLPLVDILRNEVRNNFETISEQK